MIKKVHLGAFGVKALADKLFMKTFLFSVMFLFSVFGFAGEDPCFSRVESPVLKIYSQTSLDVDSKMVGLMGTCKELKKTAMYEKKGVVRSLAEGFVQAVGVGGMFGLGASAFSKMNNNEHQKQYMSELEKIKTIPDRMERIKRVYELVSTYQGQYDYDSLGKKTDFVEGKMVGALRPENLVDAAKKNGTAGVCRHFAALLYWSLLQVGRSSESKDSALGENDFSVSYMTGDVPLAGGNSGGHAWVRVNLPIKNEKGVRDFRHFDLDTTWYPQDFTVLMPRRSGLSENARSKAVSDCQEVKSCLMKRSIQQDQSFRSKQRTTEAGGVR